MPTGREIPPGTPLSIDFEYLRRAGLKETARIRDNPAKTVWHLVRRRAQAGAETNGQTGQAEFAVGFAPSPNRINRWMAIVLPLGGVSGHVSGDAIESLAGFLGMKRKAERQWVIPSAAAERKVQEGMRTDHARKILEGLGFRSQGDDDAYIHPAFRDTIILPYGDRISPRTQRLIRAAVEKLGRKRG